MSSALNQILYPNVVINNVRNSNTVVQASQINGGNLAQFLNLQAMRTARVNVVLASTGPYGGSVGGNGSVCINEYDGSPFAFGPGDVVVAAVVENASGVSGGLTNTSVEALTGSSSTAQFFYSSYPTYNSNTSTWTAGTVSATALAASITIAQLNAGLNLSISNPSVPQTNQWLNCVTGTALFTNNVPSVNLTMLIMNPVLSQ